jgi:hypothetical protein
MNNNDLKKLVTHAKELPEMYKILKNFILDYLSIKEQNKKLVETNLELLNEIDLYKEAAREQLNTELVIH